VISGVRWDISLFLCLWKGGWKRCFGEGGRDFSKGCFLSAMGREIGMCENIGEFLFCFPTFFQGTHTTLVIG
jgi:hypothetical protein